MLPGSSCFSLLSGSYGRPGPRSLLELAELVQHLGDVVGDVAQVAAVDAHRQVDRRLEVVVRDLGRHGRPVERDDVPQRDRRLACLAGLVIGMSSSVSIDLMSFSRYCTPTKYWFLLTGSIQKLCLVELDARVERGDDVLHDVGLGQPQVGRLGAVDLDDVLGIVEPLDDPRRRPRRRS